MSLTLVGDPAQSIYLWRSSKVNLFLDFHKLFPAVKTYTILKNYRTPRQLVEISNKFRELFRDHHEMAHTPSEPHLDEMPDVLDIKDFQDPEQEIAYILKDIRGLHTRENVPYSKMSILCRRNEDLTRFESGLVSMGIPYYLKFDSSSLMNQSAFRILYALYSFLIDPSNLVAFCEIITPIKGIGSKFLDKIKPYHVCGQSCLEVFGDANAANIPGSHTQQWGSIRKFISGVLAPAVEYVGRDISFPVLNRGIFAALSRTILYEEDKWAPDRIGYYMKRAQIIEVFNTLSTLYQVSCQDARFNTLSGWDQFQEIYENLQMSQDVHNEVATKDGAPVKKEDRDALGLYTVHSYKGKENDYIYYAMTRGTWSIDPFDFESKCVFYVAITRSRRKLTVSGSEFVRGFDETLRRSFENPFVIKLKRIVENYQ